MVLRWQYFVLNVCAIHISLFSLLRFHRSKILKRSTYSCHFSSPINKTAEFDSIDGFRFEKNLLQEIPSKSKIFARRRLDEFYELSHHHDLRIDFNTTVIKAFNDISEVLPQSSKAFDIYGIKVNSNNLNNDAILWLPTQRVFPTIDAIIAIDLKVFFLSITTSKSHSLVIKCLKSKDPNKGARANRRRPLEYNGLIPMIMTLKSNGFKMDIENLPFIWGVPLELHDAWLTKRNISLIETGIELLSKVELQLYRRMKIVHFVLQEPAISLKDS